MCRLAWRFDRTAFDFAINWSGALALREGIPLYDGALMSALAARHVTPPEPLLFADIFSSYIGPPTTAVLYLPFSVLPYTIGAAAYRVSGLLAYFIAVLIAAGLVDRSLRQAAWATGGLCLGFWYGPGLSLELGQVDPWIVMILALALRASQRGRWAATGAFVGVAALLKVSPALLLLYCSLRRRWAAVWAGCGVIAAGGLISAVPRHGADLHQFLFEVLPRLGGASLHVQNQALGAFLARLSSHNVDLLAFSAPVGRMQWVGICMALALMALLWWQHRTVDLTPQELSLPILLALLAGPITWDHYTSWAVLPAVLLLPKLKGRLLLAGVFFAFFLVPPTLYVVPSLLRDSLVVAHPSIRVATGLHTIGLLGVMTVGLVACRHRRLR